MAISNATKLLAGATVIAVQLLCSVPADAQFWDKLSNPEYEVPIAHPPQVSLKPGQKIVVCEFSGDNGAELSARFSQALLEDGKYEVLDRANLSTIMREQGLQAGASFDSDSALKLGKLSGAGAMFVGRVTRCGVEQSPVLAGRTVTSSANGTQREYAIRVTARITANVQLVDLTTGRTHTGKLVEVAKSLENKALGGVPEPPSSEEALTAAYQEAIQQLKRVILPWTETVKLVVYDDKKMSLDRSAGQIKVGDFEGAVKTLTAVVDSGMANPKEQKTYAKVYYNLGIAQMYSGNLDKAIEALNKSGDLRATEIVTAAIKTARQMQQLKKESDRVEANPLALGAIAKPAGQSGEEAKSSSLTNKDIIGMVEAKLPDTIIISKMKHSSCKMDTSPEALIALKKAGASDAVILEITQLPSTQKDK